MTIKEIVKFFTAHKKRILIVGLVFSIVGVLYYYTVPVKHEAVGTLFVSRYVDTPVWAADFTYEGYYAQQNALSYTETLIGLIQSDDIKNVVLKQLRLKPDESNLRRFGRSISARKQAPQLIRVTVKEFGGIPPEVAWETLVDTTILASNELNRDGDSRLVVQKITKTPLIKEPFRNVFVNAFVGFGLGALTTTLYFAIRRYFGGK